MALRALGQTPDVQAGIDNWYNKPFVISYIIASAGATSQDINVQFPMDCMVKSVQVGETAFDTGDKCGIAKLDSSNNLIATYADDLRIKAAQTYETIEFPKPIFLNYDTSADTAEGMQITLDSAGATAKNFIATIQYLIPKGRCIINMCQDVTNWVDAHGAARNPVSAASGDAVSIGTTYKFGNGALQTATTAANTGNNEYVQQELTLKSSINLSSMPYIFWHWRFSAVAGISEFGLILEDSGGDWNYYQQTGPAIATWKEHGAVPGSPTGNGGAAADLTDITKVIFYWKQPAAAINSTWIIDGVHAWLTKE